MQLATSLRTAVSVAVVSCVLASTAHAASSRTYVANLGMDSNASSNCGHAAPCGTLAVAYGVTSPGGEIVALDVAGYGPLTITGPVTITAIAGGFVNVVSGTTGITINTGNPTDLVILRNIQISGAAGSTGNIGIDLQQGRLLLENSTIRGIGQDGLNVAANTKSDLVNTAVIGNQTGINTQGTGTSPSNLSPPNGATQVRISGGSVVDNTTAFIMVNPGVDPSSQSQSTILIANNPFLTHIAGNATYVICPKPVKCNQVLGYQESLSSNPN
jgi:hypothetical protein